MASNTQKLKNILSQEEFDIIITSPLRRAKHTAEIINEAKKINIIFDDRIIERNYRQLESQEFKKDYCNLDYDFESIVEESIEIYKSRLKEFIDDVKKKYYDKKQPICLKLYFEL